MTTGVFEIGNPGGSDFYFRKSWSGADDPAHKAENSYNLEVVRRTRSKSAIIGSPSAPAYYANCGTVLTDPWTSNDQLALFGKLAEGIRGHNFNLAIAAGEGRETISMVVGAVSAMHKSVKALKRGDGSNALRHLGLTGSGNSRGKTLDTKDISSTWLSIQYGWKPLLNDVFESAKAFEKLSAKPRKSTVRVQHRAFGVGDTSASPSNWSCPCTRFTSKRFKATFSEPLSSARSLGLLNPLSLAWELVPFSFVADWFAPIGTYFDALGAKPTSLDFLLTESSLSRQKSSVGVIKNATVYDRNGFSDNYERVVVTRVPNVGFSPPRPQFNNPDRIYSTGRLKNALALAHQVFT